MLNNNCAFISTSKQQILRKLDHFRDIPYPYSLETLLNNFSEFVGCACFFLNFENKYVYSYNCNEISFCDLGVEEDVFFDEIAKLKSEREDDCIELMQEPNVGSVFVPVKIKDIIYGYFFCGHFIEDKKTKISKNLSRGKIEENVKKAKAFVKGLECQFELSYELKNEITKNREAANELRIQKTFFENLFDYSPEGIILLDNEDKVIQANQEFLSLFEYTQEELKSQNINDLIVPERFKDEGLIATKEASSGNRVEMTTIRQTKTGKQIHVEVTGKPIVMDNSQLAVYVVYRNITQQVWNQKSQQIIYNISELLSSSKNSLEVIDKIREELEQIIGVGKIFLELIAPNGRSLKVIKEGNDDFINICYHQSLSSCVIREKRMMYFNSEEIQKVVKKNKLKLLKTHKKWLGIPLIEKECVLGVLGVSFDADHSELSMESIKLIELISGQLASGISKKRKELELRMLERSTEQSPASIVITDTKGNIEYVNPKFCNVTGYELIDVIGKNPRFLKSGATHSCEYKNMWETVLSGEEWSGEFLNVKKNRELFWERVNFSPIKNELGETTHLLAVKEDVTELKKSEKELLQSKNRAEESDRLKSAFLSNISHELRTPLNAVIGFSNLCDESLSKSEILEFIRLIHKSGNQLLGIIEDILNFTSIECENFQLEIEEFFMFRFLDDLKLMAKKIQAQENKDHLRMQFKADKNYTNILISTDYQRLLQAVTNLIINALKFTIKGFVEVGYVVENEYLCLYVKDSGVGIEKNKKKIIFDRFRQADDSITRTFGGTGLGLAISKKIMDMLGGSIKVESEPNKGSIFSLRLKCIISKKEEGNKPAEQSSAECIDSQLILVAEDEISNFKLIEAILSRNGYKVIRAENGKEAVDLCHNRSDIDLVLMDIRMPVMDGLIATKEIKKFNSDLPIIAQTAYAMDGDENKAIKEGCDDYISKPINKRLLLEKIKYFLS